MGFRISKNTFNNKATEATVRAAIGLYADTAAKKMEGEAKGNASWTDRTSNARNSILGDSGWKGKHAVISLSGNVNYFPYLELAMEKKYSILLPTIQKNAPEVLRGYRRIF